MRDRQTAFFTVILIFSINESKTIIFLYIMFPLYIF